MIREDLDQVRETINAACIRVDRRPEEVALIAVSKTKPVPMLEEVYAAGIRDFGENKAQEIPAKKPELPQDIHRHMIGHPQCNKVSQVIGNAVMIHSVDSLCLARQIEAEAAKKEVDVDIPLEANVAREESKYGFALEEVEGVVMVIKDSPHMHIKGLMTITPFVDSPEENRGIFKKLLEFTVDIGRENIDNVTMGMLSVGVTRDYEVAVEEGATMARVGTGIFGIRQGVSVNELIAGASVWIRLGGHFIQRLESIR